MNADITALFNYYRLARRHVELTELDLDADLTGAQQRAASLLYDWQTAAILSLDLMQRGHRPY